MRTLVVVPTYCEADNIVEFLERLRRGAPNVDVLVVDDTSPDGTGAIATTEAARLGRIEVLERPTKDGLGTAYRAGFAWGIERDYEVLVEIDADLSHDPAAVPLLLDGIERGADLAVGSRYVPGGSIPDWPWSRRALSRWGNRYASFMLGLAITDATSGYRAFRTEVLQTTDYTHTRAHGYAFQIELAYRVGQTGARIVEVPIVFTDRTRGRSKMSPRIALEAMLLVTWWGITRRVTKLRRRSLD